MKKVAIRSDRADLDTIERLFREEGPRMWRSLVAFTGGRSEIADDAVAEAFAQALRYAPSIRNPRPWLYRTAFRAAARELRREQRHEYRDVDLATVDREGDRVIPLVRQLSRNQRASIVLHYYLGFSVRDVAQVLGISTATARVHLHRGRRRLERLLGEPDG